MAYIPPQTPTMASKPFQDQYTTGYNQYEQSAGTDNEIQAYIDNYGRIAYKYKKQNPVGMISFAPPQISPTNPAGPTTPTTQNPNDPNNPTKGTDQTFGRDPNRGTPGIGSMGGNVGLSNSGQNIGGIGPGTKGDILGAAKAGFKTGTTDVGSAIGAGASALGLGVVGDVASGVAGAIGLGPEAALGTNPQNVAGYNQATRPGAFVEAMMNMAVPGLGSIAKAIGSAFAGHMNDLAAQGHTISGVPGFSGAVGLSQNALGGVNLSYSGSAFNGFQAINELKDYLGVTSLKDYMSGTQGRSHQDAIDASRANNTPGGLGSVDRAAEYSGQDRDGNAGGGPGRSPGGSSRGQRGE